LLSLGMAMDSLLKKPENKNLVFRLLFHHHPSVRVILYQRGVAEEGAGSNWNRFWEDFEREQNLKDLRSDDPEKCRSAQFILELMAEHGVKEAQILWAKLEAKNSASDIGEKLDSPLLL